MFVPTPASILRGHRYIEHQGIKLFVIGRHSAGHRVPPHKVNYHAMALGMKQLGVRACLSTAASGSFRRDWLPGTLVACTDFLDFTGRYPTLFDRTVVHTDFTVPFSEIARSALLSAGAKLGYEIQERGVYLSDNGPRFETPAEIEMYKSLGADLAGMTAATEAVLMHEAGVEYACLAIVTNLAAGISSDPITHEEVLDEMKRSGAQSGRDPVGSVDGVGGRCMSLPRRTFALHLAMTCPESAARSVTRILARNDLLGRSAEEFLSLSPEALREEYRLTTKAAQAMAEGAGCAASIHAYGRKEAGRAPG